MEQIMLEKKKEIQKNEKPVRVIIFLYRSHM